MQEYKKTYQGNREEPAEYEWQGTTCSECGDDCLTSEQQEKELCGACIHTLCHCERGPRIPDFDECGQCVITYYTNHPEELEDQTLQQLIEEVGS